MDRKFFKSQANYDGFSKMHPKMQEVAVFAINQALILGVKEPMITETLTTVELDKALGRVSSSHSQGRAIDFRTWNLLPEQLKSLNGLLTAKYGSIGAINKLGIRQLVVHHDIGKGDHLHIQLDGSFKV
jgi:hypothetical protein